MNYSTLTQRIQGETVDAWALHYRAHKALQCGEDVLLLSVGDPDFATPDSIIEVAVAALRNGDTHYAEISGRDTLRDAIAADHQQRSGQSTGRENVIVLAGAQNGLFATSLCIVESGDEVIVLQPMYITYEACIRTAGAKLVPVPLDASRGFRLDIDALRTAITVKTRAIYFATPNNPAGTVMRRDELEAVAALAIEHDLWVVSDEVYCDITFDSEHHCIAGLPGMAERTVTINSLSKSYAMTGWRLGWVIAPPELVEHLGNVSLSMLYGLPGFIQEAGVYALTQARCEVDAMRAAYRRRRDLLMSALDTLPLLDYITPEAAMYLMVDVRKTGLSSSQFANALYEETGVSTLDAATFGACATGFVRIAFTLSEAQLHDACTRIEHFMARFAGGGRSPAVAECDRRTVSTRPWKAVEKPT